MIKHVQFIALGFCQNMKNLLLIFFQASHNHIPENLIDLKSLTLGIMVNYLGLGNPYRYAFTATNAIIPNAALSGAIFSVALKNYDPRTLIETDVINGVQFSYRFIHDQPAGSIADVATVSAMAMDLEEFKQLGPTKVTLSPFTLAQNSLHGSFGASGDLAAVPPKSATIGPVQYLEAKYTINSYAIGVHGTATSWQRLITRLCLFGPVTPRVPDSIVQLREPGTGEVRVAESIARKIEVDWDKGY